MALEERRVVTVLFADLVGYTTLAEHRDPEKVKRLIESCFERLVADIEAFGGRVDKLLGDAIVALFGAPVAHEDDAERAVRAGAADAGDAGPLRPAGRHRRAPRSRCASASTPARCSSARWPAPTTRRWATSSTPPRGCRRWPRPAACSSAAPPPRCAPRPSSREPFGVTRDPGTSRSSSRGSSPAPRGRHPAGALRRAVRRAGQRAGAARRRRRSSCATATAGSCRSSARPAPARPARRGDRRAAGGRGDRGAHGLRALRRVQRLGAGDHRLSTLFGLDLDVNAEDVARTVEAKRHELWGLRPGDAELERLPRRDRPPARTPSPLDRLDAAGARDTLAGDRHRHAAPPRPDPDDGGCGSTTCSGPIRCSATSSP